MARLLHFLFSLVVFLSVLSGGVAGPAHGHRNQARQNRILKWHGHSRASNLLARNTATYVGNVRRSACQGKPTSQNVVSVSSAATTAESVPSSDSQQPAVPSEFSSVVTSSTPTSQQSSTIDVTSASPVIVTAAEATSASIATPATSASPSPPATLGQTSTDTSSSDIAEYLSDHNTVRAQHGAAPLSWNGTLATAAQQWANNCVFQHSGGSLGPYGENLAAGTGSSYGIDAAIQSWTNEVSEYDPNNPQPSHFTQVVWKATTQLGCAVQECSGIFPSSYGEAKFYVCEYYPQGNVIGEFGQNVQA
ncbi:hypothetical protein AcV5_004441 [Taiwanofungus camphoratus]|nr:hypothetical protein AcW2_000965 [Antrodia cinnamomea]KAI0936258.1 hypothetical protein AcV5_004441 [Antrodia cinnamomea]